MSLPDCAGLRSLPPELQHPFSIIAFDWEGTAVMGRQEDAGHIGALIQRLLDHGVLIVVITDTNFVNIDRQVSATMSAPSKRILFIVTNRGSEVYGFTAEGKPIVLWRRVATPAENRVLTTIANATRDALAARTGLNIRVVYNRMNRRKIDLIPLAEWGNPHKSALGDLLQAVQTRLDGAGLAGGLRAVVDLVERTAREQGLTDARVTSDVKHVEIGLTDRSDAVNWMMCEVAQLRGIPPADILIAGDEFGPICGVEGSDGKLVTPLTHESVFVSVGPEPGGVPPGVIHLNGGPTCFRELLACQAALHEQPGQQTSTNVDPIDLPIVPTVDPSWLLVEDGFHPAREHEIESLFAVANGYVGTRGALVEGTSASAPATFVASVFGVRTETSASPELVMAPDWARLRFRVDGNALRLTEGDILEERRILDLRQGILWREWRHRDVRGRITRLRGLRLASLADRHLLLQLVTRIPENYSGHMDLEALIAPSTGNPNQPAIIQIELFSPPSSGPTAAVVLRTLGMGMTVVLMPSSRLGSAKDERVAPAVDTRDARLMGTGTGKRTSVAPIAWTDGSPWRADGTSSRRSRTPLGSFHGRRPWTRQASSPATSTRGHPDGTSRTSWSRGTRRRSGRSDLPPTTSSARPIPMMSASPSALVA